MHRLWHGGVPGLAVGDRLLPPSETGHQHTWAETSAAIGLRSIAQRRDRVYVTSDRELAKVFARTWHDGARERSHGWLYEVSADDLEDDADLLSVPGISFQVGSALIIRVADRGVAPDHRASRRALERVLRDHESARSRP